MRPEIMGRGTPIPPEEVQRRPCVPPDVRGKFQAMPDSAILDVFTDFV
jgi:hypothetical protein